ncbi:MAG: hypothetical protein Kow00108_18960 [Calditrichia bacterium]
MIKAYKKLIKIPLLLVLLQLTLSAIQCHKNEIPDSPVLAQVEDRYLTQEELETMTPDVEGMNVSQFRDYYIQHWINNQIFLHYIKQQSIELTKKNQILLEQYRIELLRQQVLKNLLNTSVQITDAEIQEYYQNHREEYKRVEDEYHFILLRLEKPNIGIEDDIKHNSSLLDVIEKNFLDNRFHGQLEYNGDQGYIPVSKIKKEILRVMKRNKIGKIIKYKSREAGIYYIQVLDYKKAGSFKEIALVKSEIKTKLTQNKLMELFQSLIQDQRNGLIIEKFESNLK